MAGYKEGEARILDLVQSLTHFNTTNSAIGDWTILNSGESDEYAILKPGEHGDPEYITMRTYRAYWKTVIEVWWFWNIGESDTDNLQFLEDRAQEVIDGLQPYRKTNDSGGTVLHAEIGPIGPVNEIKNQDGGMEWLMQEVTFGWDEEISVTFEE